MVERQARDLEVRGLNPGLGLNFSLEFKLQFFNAQTIGCIYLSIRFKNAYKTTKNIFLTFVLNATHRLDMFDNKI